MKAIEALTLQSFTLAVSKLELSLPDTVQAAVRQVGEKLADCPEENLGEVTREIDELVKRHTELQAQYEQMRDRLKLQQNAQERTKSLNGVTANLSGSNSGSNFQTLLANVLVISDKRKLTPEVSKLAKQPEFQRFAQFLKDAILSLDEHSKTVLQALESQPFPTKDLAALVDLPYDRTWTIVQNLWKQGYLYPIQANWLHLIFPGFAHRFLKQAPLTPETYLTTTFKGQFALHPFVTQNGSAKRSVNKV